MHLVTHHRHIIRMKELGTWLLKVISKSTTHMKIVGKQQVRTLCHSTIHMKEIGSIRVKVNHEKHKTEKQGSESNCF